MILDGALNGRTGMAENRRAVTRATRHNCDVTIRATPGASHNLFQTTSTAADG